MHPSIASQDQSIPLSSSYASSPACHSVRNTPAATHSWNRSWAVDPGQMPVASRAFHWHPVRSRKKMASAHTRSGVRGRPPPNLCVLGCSGNRGRTFSHSSSDTRHWSADFVRFKTPPSGYGTQRVRFRVNRIGS
jgi:hypothetical protein